MLPVAEPPGPVGAPRFAHRFRALAVDFDGTLTRGAAPDAEVLAALAARRAEGMRVVLVTGRILAELRNSFPEVDAHADVIVGENGAVVGTGQGDHPLVAPVPFVLEDALVRRGVPVRRGQVLLACDAVYDTAVLQEIHRLGLDCQLVYNRAALMVLPAGVSKATGVREGLAGIGLSTHNTLAIGDAENDHALLGACGFGVAVANAVPSLRAQADLVTTAADGQGVREVLEGPILAGATPARPARWRIELGRDAQGGPVLLPATETNLLIVGGSNAGKSHAGGMCAEALVEMGMCALVIDVEGDHAGLGTLPGVLVMGGHRMLPDPREVALLLRHRCGSMVVDLSMLTPADQDEYIAALAPVIADLRDRVGLPHWILTDEAHRPYGAGAPILGEISGYGHCLISWSPGKIDRATLARIDHVLALPPSERREAGGHEDPPMEPFLADWGAAGGEEFTTRCRELFGRAQPGQALFADRSAGDAVLVTLGARRTNHVRHWHKYAQSELPPDKRFRFRGPAGRDTGWVAANLYEFHHILRQAPDEVVGHHSAHGDFSRWATQALQDAELGRRCARAEGAGSPGDQRVRILTAIEQRYLTHAVDLIAPGEP